MAWQSFVLAHYLRHETIAGIITGQLTRTDLSHITTKDKSWMLDHAQAHLDICLSKNINATPGLDQYDLEKEDEFNYLMKVHWQEHDLIDLSLGL
jgi:hypothetical protein